MQAGLTIDARCSSLVVDAPLTNDPCNEYVRRIESKSDASNLAAVESTVSMVADKSRAAPGNALARVSRAVLLGLLKPAAVVRICENTASWCTSGEPL